MTEKHKPKPVQALNKAMVEKYYQYLKSCVDLLPQEKVSVEHILNFRDWCREMDHWDKSRN